MAVSAAVSAKKQKRPSGAKPRVKREEREAQILEAAEDVFAAQGYAETKMEDIAARCDITKPMLYSYFGSKQGLYAIVLQKVGLTLAAHLVGALKGQLEQGQLGQGEDRLLPLTQFVRRRGRLARDIPASLMADQDFADLVESHRAKIEQEGTRVLAQLRPAGMAEEDAMKRIAPYAMALLGAADGGVTWWAGQPDVPAEEAERLSRNVLNMFIDLIKRELATNAKA